MALIPFPSFLGHRKLDQYCGNVALKVNTKLGGSTSQMAGEVKEPRGWAPLLGDKHFMVCCNISRSESVLSLSIE